MEMRRRSARSPILLHARGYGLMRQRQARAGRVYCLFKATWIGNGPPPDDPFAPYTEATTGARQMKSKQIHENGESAPSR